MEDIEIKKMKITDFLPKKWNKCNSVFHRAYQVMKLDLEDLPESGHLVINLNRVTAVIVFGKLKYQKLGQQLETNEGCYISFLTPIYYNEKKPKFKDGLIKYRIETAVGFLKSIFGKNIAFKQIFDNEVGLKKQFVASWSDPIENFRIYPKPDIKSKSLNKLQKSFRDLSKDKKNILLSFDWFNKASDLDFEDQFITLWIALEALIGYEGRNLVSKINQNLKNIYGKKISDIGKTFQIGRLYGIRKKIFHEGIKLATSNTVNNYLSAIYEDLLLHILNLPPEERSLKIKKRAIKQMIKLQKRI